MCVIGDERGAIVERERFATRDPEATLADMVAFFRRATAGGRQLDGIGVAAFGPLELREEHPAYGSIALTPKPGWSHTDLIGPLREFGAPIAIDTDVNGAALAEARWGAAQGCDQFLYFTIGTGIGGGVLVGGRPVHGLVHPEVGHVSVPRQPGDEYSGGCPFHGDCFEGMASGPAVAARWGRGAETLEGADLERAVDLEAAYIAAGIRNVVYALAPQRIVIGGGISEMPGLFPRIRTHLADQLGGYPGHPEHGDDTFVIRAGLGGDAGPAGSLALAAIAADGG